MAVTNAQESRRRRALIGTAALAVAGAVVVMSGAMTAGAPHGASQAPRVTSGTPGAVSTVSRPARVVTVHRPAATPPQLLYVYEDTGGDLCAAFSGSVANWGNCRNADEALQNQNSRPNRIYYSPNFGGAHSCLPPYTGYSNLNHADQVFNSDTGAGYGQQVWLNVASSRLFDGSCSDPLPGGTYYGPPGGVSRGGA